MTNAAGRRIRILIVDDDAEMRENLKKLMTLETDIEVVGVATGGIEGVEMAAELRPDVITMDINMQDMDGLAATSKILAENRRVAIVILSVQHDMQYFRRAMQVGACDFLTKPPEPDELFNAIRRCYEGLPDEDAMAAAAQQPQTLTRDRAGHVVSVYSPKGGVGTTTLATNLAVGLARRGGATCLVDADLQFGDVGIFLNLRLPNSVADVTESRDELDPETVDMVLGDHNSGARILLAPRSPEAAESVVAENLGELLGFLRQSFQYVVVDTGSVINDHLLAVLDVTDRLVIASTPDIPSLKNVSLFYELLELLRFPLTQTWFVLNRLVSGSAITAERVQDRLNRQVVAGIEDDPVFALRAINAGEPLINYDPAKAPAVRGLIDFVKFVEHGIAAEIEAMETEEVGGGRISSLFAS